MKQKDILKRPIITEKSMQDSAMGKYTFEVDPRSTKTMISRVISELFGVHPVRVSIVNMKGKARFDRKSRKKVSLPVWKKAIVTLKEGEKIDLFEVGE